jgi:hypothetical protein
LSHDLPSSSGRPRRTWKRAFEEYALNEGKTWKEV